MPNRSPRRRTTRTTQEHGEGETTDPVGSQQPTHDRRPDRRYPTWEPEASVDPSHPSHGRNPRGSDRDAPVTRVVRPRGTDTRGEAVPQERTDSELLIASRTEPEAFTELYRRHAETCCATSRDALDPETAAELTAETFAEASPRGRPIEIKG